MYNLMSLLKLRTLLSKPPTMFPWDAVDTSPYLRWLNCPPKPSRCLFDIIAGPFRFNRVMTG